MGPDCMEHSGSNMLTFEVYVCHLCAPLWNAKFGTSKNFLIIMVCPYGSIE